jgi:hypothetical protein
MRKIIIAIFLIASFGCQKAKEKAQETLIMQAITNGQWKVTMFNKAGTDISTDFLPIMFQFRSDFTVDALNTSNSAVITSGTWGADPNGGNMSATFGSATEPVVLLNGTWHITDNSFIYVEAYQNVSAGEYKLRLDKL